jgi:hypothetical protein
MRKFEVPSQAISVDTIQGKKQVLFPSSDKVEVM